MLFLFQEFCGGADRPGWNYRLPLPNVDRVTAARKLKAAYRSDIASNCGRLLSPPVQERKKPPSGAYSVHSSPSTSMRPPEFVRVDDALEVGITSGSRYSLWRFLSSTTASWIAALSISSNGVATCGW